MMIVVEVRAIDAIVVNSCLGLVEDSLGGAENADIVGLAKIIIDCLSKLQGHGE